MNKAAKVWIALMASCLLASSVSALEIIEEVRFDSVNGEPVREEFSFPGQGYEDFILKVINGTAEGFNRISSAVINLNGIKVLGPSDFSQKVADVQRAIVPLANENNLSVSLRSHPGGFIVIQIMGEPTLNLPPDPGPAGDETIEGIDTNDNGVRDDVERWIGLNYRDSEKTRMALTQAYYPTQNFMIHATQEDNDAVHNDMDALQRASECLFYVRRADARNLMKELHAQVVNTSDRFYADRHASRILGGGTFSSRPISKWKSSCTFNPDEIEN